MSALVELVEVSKRYTGAPALHPMNLSVAREKTTVLIGPSGCGKSTLLRLIIGLVEPDSGTITFNGSQTTPANIDMLRRRIGYVIQEGGLFPHLTARANVLLMAHHLGKSQSEMRTRLTELCELTRFSGTLLERYPLELSGGRTHRAGNGSRPIGSIPDGPPALALSIVAAEMPRGKGRSSWLVIVRQPPATIRTRTAAKAVPRSRNTSMVMCHSPSHFMAGRSSVKGWTAL